MVSNAMTLFSPIARGLRRLCKLLHWSWRACGWALLCLALLALGFLAVVRFWLMPNLDRFRPEIIHELSSLVGRPVEIARIDGEWSGGHLAMRLTGFRIAGKTPSLAAQEAYGEVGWLGLLQGDIHFRYFEARGVEAHLRRDRQGHWWLGDFALDSAPAQDQSGLSRLLAQNALRLRSASLWFQDERCQREAQRLLIDEAHYQRGFLRRQLALRLKPDWGNVPWQQFSLAWRGPDDAPQRWRGHAEMALALPLERLTALACDAPENLRGLSGQINAQAKLAFADGALQQASVSARSSNLGLPDYSSLIQLDSQLELTLARDGRYQLHVPRWLAKNAQGQLELSGLTATARANGDQGELQLPPLDLVRLRPLSALLPLPAAVQQWIKNAQPAGTIEAARLRWSGRWQQPQWQGVQLRFAGLTAQASDEIPGLSPLDGELSATPAGGSLSVAGRALRLTIPRLFAETFSLGQVTGKLDWQQQAGEWQLKLARLQLDGPDLTGELSGLYRSDHGNPYLELQGRFSRAEAQAVPRFVPQTASADARHWLGQAFLAGQARNIALTLRGHLADFPFSRPGSGQFLVTAEADGIKLHYAPGWPTLDDIHGQLRFEGLKMHIAAEQARTVDTRISHTVVEIPDLAAAERLTVDGQVAGTTPQFFEFLRQSPLNTTLQGLTALKVEGNGELALQLDIPLDHAADTQVRGVYRLRDNRLLADTPIPEVSHINASVAFTEHGVSVEQGQGQAFGQPFVLNLQSTGPKLTLEAVGQANLRDALRFYQVPFDARVRGISDYRLLIGIENAAVDVLLQSNLEGTAIDLPAPYGKSPSEGRMLRLASRSITPGRRLWTAQYNRQLGIGLLLKTTDTGTQLERGEIELGTRNEPQPYREGLWVSGRLDRLNVAEWQALLAADNTPAGSSAFLPDGLDLDIGNIEWQGRLWPRLKVQLRRDKQRWQGSVDSPLAAGTVTFSPQGNGHIDGHLSRLALPGKTASDATPSIRRSDKPAPLTPASWPRLDLTVDELVYQDKNLGQLTLHGESQGNGYHVAPLTLNNAAGKLSGAINWQSMPEGLNGLAEVKLDWNNIGDWFAPFSTTPWLKKGKGSASARLNWQSEALLPNMAEVSGQLTLDAHRGVIPKVQPGVGRLLGLMSMQGILRRLKFDFQDVVGDGLAFDELKADGRLTRGVLNLSRFDMASPALGLSANGSIDLVQDKLDLQIKAVPAVGEGLSAAGALLINPAVGLSMLLLQEVLKNPIGRAMTFHYSIKGPLDDPEVQTNGGKP